jgi:hypothetical protein
MDVRDVALLLVRRWAVSVPLLLLTGAGAGSSALNVRPDYVATSYVSLLPPAVQHNPALGQTREANPWDADRLGDAVIVRLNTKSLSEQIRTEGFRGSWEAGADQKYGSVIRIEVTSPTEAQARATAGRLVRELDDEVARQQAKYQNLAPYDKITTTRFDSGDEVEPVTAKVWRAVVVVATGGLLLTLAVSVSVDAMLRRIRRRSGIAEVPATGTDTDETQPVLVMKVPVQMPVVRNPPAALLDPGLPRAKEPAAASGGSAPASDDSTIVLPFSNAPWAERQGSAGKAAGITPR